MPVIILSTTIHAHIELCFDLSRSIDLHIHSTATNQLRVPMTRAEVKQHMYGKNDELFERIFGAGRFTQEEREALSMQKEQRYQQDYLPELRLLWEDYTNNSDGSVGSYTCQQWHRPGGEPFSKVMTKYNYF